MGARVVFKIAGLVHQSLVGAATAYLADDCRLLSDVDRRPLRSNSNDMRKLLVPRTHNKLGDRSFSVASPRLWNDYGGRDLPSTLSDNLWKLIYLATEALSDQGRIQKMNLEGANSGGHQRGPWVEAR